MSQNRQLLLDPFYYQDAEVIIEDDEYPNEPPDAVDDYYITGQDETLTTYAYQPEFGVLNNDWDADWDPLSVIEVNGSATDVGIQITLLSGATLTLEADGSFVYNPSTGYLGTDSFSYTISDGVATDTATVFIDVTDQFQTVTWDGGGDGYSWDDPFNWDTDTLPGYQDDVIIDDDITVIHYFGTTQINSLTSSANLDFTGDLILEYDSSITGSFDLWGSLTVNGGTTSLSGGGSADAIHDIADGAVLEYVDGAFDLADGTEFTGLGNVVLANAQQAAAPQWNVAVQQGQVQVQANATLGPGGEIRGPGTVRITRSLTWTGGTMRDGRTEIAAGATMNVVGAGTRRSFDHQIVNSGTANYSRSHVFRGGSFTNNGTVNVTGGADFRRNFAGLAVPSWTNLAGTLNINDNGYVAINMEFNNTNGLVNVGNADLELSGGGVHTGTFVNPAGNLYFTNSVANTIHTFDPGSAIIGVGQVSFEGGSTGASTTIVISNGAFLDIENLHIEESLPDFLTITGPGLLRGTNINWVSGFMGGDGETEVKQGGTMTIGQGGGVITLQDRTLWNYGKIDWVANAGNIKVSNNVEIHNSGLHGGGEFLIQNQQKIEDISNPALPNFSVLDFSTNALLQKNGQGTATIEMDVENSTSDVELENNNSGLEIVGNYTVNYGDTRLFGGTFGVSGDVVQVGGYTNMQGGAFSAGTVALVGNAYFYLGGGTVATGATGFFNLLSSDTLVSGSGSITANVTNHGLLEVGDSLNAGQLTITGNYLQGANGRLKVEIGGANPGTQYDQLVINGDATLNGELLLGVLNGFDPRNQSFDVLSISGSLNGTFSTFTKLPSADIYTWAMAYSNNANNNFVRLSAS